MGHTKTAYIGLGSNVGNREAHLQDAYELLEKISVEIFIRSSLYETDAWGYESDNAFLNQCMGIKTELQPHELLSALQEIEKVLGRTQKGGKYADRTIDLDILLYEDQLINDPLLTLPHPGIAERRFVLKPLAEIASALIHPVHHISIGQMLELCKDTSRVKPL